MVRYAHLHRDRAILLLFCFLAKSNRPAFCHELLYFLPGERLLSVAHTLLIEFKMSKCTDVLGRTNAEFLRGKLARGLLQYHVNQLRNTWEDVSKCDLIAILTTHFACINN